MPESIPIMNAATLEPIKNRASGAGQNIASGTALLQAGIEALTGLIQVKYCATGAA